MAVPFIVGMNSSGGGGNDDIFMRDLARKGRWVAADGPLANQTLDPSFMDYNTFFPTSLPSGTTAAILVIFDGLYTGPLGLFDWTIDSRFTVVSNAGGDPDITFTTSSAGIGQVNVGGLPRRASWQLRVTGPFASLSAGQRGLKILPNNDPHPERLYSEAWRASMAGVKHFRPMEILGTNSGQIIPTLTGKGGKTGQSYATIEAIVQGCNDLGMGLTLNIHPMGDAGYRSDMYTEASKLAIGTYLYVEASNEVWNRAFLANQYFMHQGWMRGLYGAGGNATKPAVVGWTPTSYTGVTPFDPDYTTTGGAPFFGRTTQSLTSGSYIFGNIYGYGDQIFQVVGNQASGAIFPGEGNSAFVRIATQDDLDAGKYRFVGDLTKQFYDECLVKWLAAGHSADHLRPVVNIQSGPILGSEDIVLSYNDHALRRTHYSVQQAPYWYTFNGEDVGTDPVEKILDRIAFGDKADIEAKQHWVRDRRAAIIAATPAGLPIPGSDCHEVYEAHYHDVTRGARGALVFNAFRHDPRTGINLKYGLTLHGRDNPGTLYQIFALVSGDSQTTTEGWGIYFYASEALSGVVSCPGGIALREWIAAAVSGLPTADVLYETVPDAGVRTVSVIVGPNISTAFTGVVRASGTRTFDLPFTKAANSAIADVTYAALPGDALTFTIVPQPGVFTVGSLSGGSAVDPNPPVLPSQSPARLVEMGLVPLVAEEILKQFSGVTSPSARRFIAHGVPAEIAQEFAAQAVGTRSVNRLIQFGIAPDLAREIAK